MSKFVILSTSLILEEGVFEVRRVSRKEAQEWVEKHAPENYCGHETVRILGLEPDKSRKQCPGYDQALCLSPKSRLEFGREYSIKEIMKIGVKFTLITKEPILKTFEDFERRADLKNLFIHCVNKM